MCSLPLLPQKDDLPNRADEDGDGDDDDDDDNEDGDGIIDASAADPAAALLDIKSQRVDAIAKLWKSAKVGQKERHVKEGRERAER